MGWRQPYFGRIRRALGLMWQKLATSRLNLPWNPPTTTSVWVQRIWVGNGQVKGDFAKLGLASTESALDPIMIEAGRDQIWVGFDQMKVGPNSMRIGAGGWIDGMVVFPGRCRSKSSQVAGLRSENGAVEHPPGLGLTVLRSHPNPLPGSGASAATLPSDGASPARSSLLRAHRHSM